MTDFNLNDFPDVCNSISTLRDSIDAITCAADLLPDDDNIDLPVGILFKRLSERLHGDLASVTCDLFALLKKPV